jgi:hypothetical protein
LDHRSHVARIIFGGACEQWFSSEAFVAINWPATPVLLAGHCVLSEDRKRDLIVRNDTQRVVATIESKVIYNNKNLWSAITQLDEQLQRDAYDDEVPECARGGLMYMSGAIISRAAKSKPWQIFTR